MLTKKKISCRCLIFSKNESINLVGHEMCPSVTEPWRLTVGDPFNLLYYVNHDLLSMKNISFSLGLHSCVGESPISIFQKKRSRNCANSNGMISWRWLDKQSHAKVIFLFELCHMLSSIEFNNYTPTIKHRRLKFNWILVLTKL